MGTIEDFFQLPDMPNCKQGMKKCLLYDFFRLSWTWTQTTTTTTMKTPVMY